MTDEADKRPTESLPDEDSQPQPEELSSEQRGAADDDFDVESALAAVASLHTLAQENADAPASEIEPQDEEDEGTSEPDDDDPAHDLVAVEEAAEPADRPAEPEPLPVRPRRVPAPSTLHRGQLASSVPALALIVGGGLLTLVLTTSDTTFEPLLLVSLGVLALGALLLVQWLSTGRWAQGNFFLGTVLLLEGALLLALQQGSLAPLWSIPLFVAALGLAFLLSVLLAGAGARLLLPGLGLLLTAGLLAAFQAALLSEDVLHTLSNLWPLLLVVFVLLLIAPLLRRRQE